ncbi:hypothetical protein D623_10022822 [Myotis brandtii]|uniref:Uncharacterized protein n=1 Tax=Myotis brandtii TaxID=109478 RepID=S7PZP6_MYOBR|nr:hypothetical protein D623_10022822 [Myotis brandtii]
MNMLVAVAQSPGQGESPFGSSPHTATALLSVLLPEALPCCAHRYKLLSFPLRLTT